MNKRSAFLLLLAATVDGAMAQSGDGAPEGTKKNGALLKNGSEKEAVDATSAYESPIKMAGPISLFDGKTLDGWNQIPADSWTVKDGVIASLGKGRGVLYTSKQYEHYRLMFTVRHVSGKPDHKAAVLFFCTAPAGGEKAADALGGIQFQVPTGSHWDYRKGHDNSGDAFFEPFARGPADFHQWSRVELLVDTNTGTARVAVSQPIGSKAVEVGKFTDPSAGKKGPVAFQMHNGGLFDEYKDITIEVNPAVNDLITTK